jgi:hypothetical protein
MQISIGTKREIIKKISVGTVTIKNTPLFHASTAQAPAGPYPPPPCYRGSSIITNEHRARYFLQYMCAYLHGRSLLI